MSNEAPDGPAEAPHREGHSRGGGGEPAPLQSRANFLENWNWASVTEINRGLCARGGAQPGIGRETHEAVAREWEEVGSQELTLGETLDFLKSCHRRAPFLFFNGNTFAEIGRALANALFHDLPLVRRKEVASAVAHFITGVLDQNSMAAMIASCTRAMRLSPGDRVRTLRGTLHGVIVRVLDDGRVGWRADGGTSEMIALPETLTPDE
jgi:hypothetical protein